MLTVSNDMKRSITIHFLKDATVNSASYCQHLSQFTLFTEWPLCVYTYTHIYIYIHTHLSIHIDIYTHTYTYIHIHTCVYTDTHTYIFFHHTTCESTCDTLSSSATNQGDNTVSVAQGGTATPGATKQFLPPDRVFKRNIYLYIH